MSRQSENYGIKTTEHKYKEIFSYILKKERNWTENRRCAYMNGEYDPFKWKRDEYHVICDTKRKLMLRSINDDGMIIWHPYIEKARIFENSDIAYEFASKINWKKSGLNLDEYILSTGCYGSVFPAHINIGNVHDMTIGTGYSWQKFDPFRAQTGIKAYILNRV